MKDKILPRNILQKRIVEHRERGEKVVFTNGCFDIIHAGHVQYLAQAKQLGDLLVIGLNTDSSVQRIKGPLRPICPEKDRAIVLAALACVDYVTLFDEETPKELIEELRPHILVKGKDYEGKEVVGRETVEACGGKVVLMPLVEGRGTSNVIAKILSIHDREKV